MTRLLLATTNVGKQRELRRLLARVAADIVTPDEIGLNLEVDEPHDTYAENAVAKADAYARASGLLSMADDSGIEVAALDWGPGVRSARWGEGRNAEKLLEALADATDRRARMICVLALARPGTPNSLVESFTGIVDGTITHDHRGSGGFGYDPVFMVPGGLTTAELTESEKDLVSHRGQAVAAAMELLRELLLEP